MKIKQKIFMAFLTLVAGAAIAGDINIQNSPETVVLKLTVNEKGNVENPIIIKNSLSNKDITDEQIIQKISMTKFSPITKNGESIKFRFVKEFKINEI